MKISETWLREWVNPPLTLAELGERLTMAGLEIEEIVPVAEKFTNVVIAEITQIKKHPEADRLNICTVDVGAEAPLTIVCGAANVQTGMKVPAALEGAVLPHQLHITQTQIRGITSQGMLCTAKELGLAEEGDELYAFPAEAFVGESVWEYFQLNDHLIDISITPNRGDCLSIKGLAYEIKALTECPLTPPELTPLQPVIEETKTIEMTAKKACPRYVGRIIRQVKADAATPLWLKERLRRSGIRSISPVVDVTNYVMLELGQPMHAFDLKQITGNITVRFAHAGEAAELLDGRVVTLDEKTLVIADQQKILAIAGVMGGMNSAVTLLTTDIFLESAFFNAEVVTRQSRHYGITSESAYRFERGVDPTLQREAIERATQLLINIVGGNPGPIIEMMDAPQLPQPTVILLRVEKISRLLGISLEPAAIENILTRLGFSIQKNTSGWAVTVPPRRADIKIEVDLIEEIARIHGYPNIPLHNPSAAMQIPAVKENKVGLSVLRRALCDLGYHEAITYSFIEQRLQNLFDPEFIPKPLVNPITADMNVMRTSLWPGLINVFLYNYNRQMSRVRLFESGLRFIIQDEKLLQEKTLAGLVSGSAFPEQWGTPTREVDFFDLKGDLENIFKLTLAAEEYTFEQGTHTALHPGQTAIIKRKGLAVGVMGSLHPSLMQTLDIGQKIFLFELDLDSISSGRLAKFLEISKFPEIRRDIAIIVDRTVPWQAIRDTIKEVAGELLMKVELFDLYQGKGIPEGRKSIAAALTLQHSSRTLVDREVADLVERVIVALKDRFTAELRG